jgi:hypothetical protein
MPFHYTVCDNDVAVDVVLASQLIGSPAFRTYTQGDCIVSEYTQTLRFTGNRSVDTPYNIYYSYTWTIRINGLIQYPVHQTVEQATMLAGDTTVDVEVKTSQRFDCGSSTPPVYQMLQQ